MKRDSTLHIVTPEPKRKKDARVGLLNASFVYVPHEKTDIRKTFERVRAEMAQRSRK
jgi:hypothetical protein